MTTSPFGTNLPSERTAIHPGTVLKTKLEECGITTADLATELGVQHWALTKLRVGNSALPFA
jgi:plasmid maintenance system antidote protein VapI